MLILWWQLNNFVPGFWCSYEVFIQIKSYWYTKAHFIKKILKLLLCFLLNSAEFALDFKHSDCILYKTIESGRAFKPTQHPTLVTVYWIYYVLIFTRKYLLSTWTKIRIGICIAKPICHHIFLSTHIGSNKSNYSTDYQYTDTSSAWLFSLINVNSTLLNLIIRLGWINSSTVNIWIYL